MYKNKAYKLKEKNCYSIFNKSSQKLQLKKIRTKMTIPSSLPFLFLIYSKVLVSYFIPISGSVFRLDRRTTNKIIMVSCIVLQKLVDDKYSYDLYNGSDRIWGIFDAK